MDPAEKTCDHVALFIPTLGGGGAERVMIMLANGLADQGVKVDLVTGNSAGSYKDSISSSVNLVDMEVSRLLFAIPSFINYLRMEKPSVVLSAIGHANILNVFFTRWLVPNSRIVVSVHNSLTARMPKQLRMRIVSKLSEWALVKADHVVTVSEGIKKQVLERYPIAPENISTIYNPLDVETISTLALQEVGHDWGDNSKLPLIIGVGRLTPQKNFELLIRSFAEVVKVLPCRLVILGDGEEREHLETIVSDLGLTSNVLMPGFVDNPFSWVGKSNVFVLSSNWEGLPGALLEAIACGVRVVSTDCETGPSEILENGKWGILTPVGDRYGLADAIIESIQSREPIDTKKRALHFSKENAIAEYLRILIPGDGK